MEFANVLSAEEVAKNKQQFLSGIASLGYDLAPVTGEFRSLQYAQDEARNLVQNILSKDPDKINMVAQGLGIGLGVLGAIPIVGYGTRIANRGLQKLYEAIGPGSKTDEVVKSSQPTESAVTTSRSPSSLDQANSEIHSQMIQRDPVFEIFVRGLPEYRRNTFAENLREYQNLSTAQRQELIGTRAIDVNEPRLISEKKAFNEYAQVEKEKEKLIQKYELAVTKPSKGREMTTVNDPLTFGQGSLKNIGEKQKHVREFIGSESYDVIAKSGVERGTADQWIGFLRNARAKGVKSEELADSGLLTFNSKGEPISGELFSISRTSPKAIITKQEILASLETNPAFNLKIRDYEYPIKLEKLIDIRQSQQPLIEDVTKILLEKSFATNPLNREVFGKIIDDIDGAETLLDTMSSDLRGIKSDTFTKLINQLDQLLIDLPQNKALTVRALKEYYQKINAINSEALKIEKLFPTPRHSKAKPLGGIDYREKVIFYDNPIPNNSSSKNAFTSHFPEPNPVAFTRYDVRGVDSYGDTFFLFELQSDPHQNISKGFKSINDKARDLIEKNQPVSITSDMMVRNNPFANKISTQIAKREKQEIIDEMKKYTDIASTRPLNDVEMKELTDLRQKLITMDFKAPEPTLQQKVNMYYSGNEIFRQNKKSYDYFPMGREETWVKLSLKSLINSAQRENKRYVALAPAEFFQLDQNNKFKIEQFYGLGAGDLMPYFKKNPKIKNENIVFKGGPEGIGKYRENTAIKTGPDKQGEEFYPGKLSGTAVLPKAAQDIVKEMGGNLSVKKVYLTDPTKPYKVLSTKREGVEMRPVRAFKSEIYRNNYSRKYGGRNYDVVDNNDPINYVESIVIDTQGMKKTPSKGYKLGGLVEVKREFFVPLI
jgi:hypothetical protein